MAFACDVMEVIHDFTRHAALKEIRVELKTGKLWEQRAHIREPEKVLNIQ